MAVTYELGDVIKRGNERWLVVRIVKSSTLFEDDRGNLTVAVEHYLELRSTRGKVDFIVLSVERNPFEGQASGIKAINPITYGRNDFNEQKADASRGESDGEGY